MYVGQRPLLHVYLVSTLVKIINAISRKVEPHGEIVDILPPNWQGLDSHSLIWVWQTLPVYPGWQLQVKLLSPSMHSPRWHGADRQSLMLVSQDIPVDLKIW